MAATAENFFSFWRMPARTAVTPPREWPAAATLAGSTSGWFLTSQSYAASMAVYSVFPRSLCPPEPTRLLSISYAVFCLKKKKKKKKKNTNKQITTPKKTKKHQIKKYK